MYVCAVANQVARQAVVGEARRRQPRLALVEWPHRVVEVRHVPRPGRDRGVDFSRARAAVSEGCHDATAVEFGQ